MNYNQVQPVDYFVNTYKRGAMTVLHRMRTWHKQKGDKAHKDGDLPTTTRHTDTMLTLTERIEELKTLRNSRKAA